MPEPAAPSPAPAAPAPSPAPAPAAPAPAPAAPAPSSLSSGQQGQQSNASEDNWVPEKFRVIGADGKLDYAATSKKLAGSNIELEKRMKDVGLPPESADKYEIKVDDAVKPVVDAVLGSEEGKEFVKQAHAAGLTTKQLNFVLNTFGKELGEIAEGAQAVRADECDAALRTVWKSDKDFNAGKGRAFQAGTFIANALKIPMQDLDKTLGNNPLFIRVLEYVGAQMGEDLPPLVDTDPAQSSKDFEQKASELRSQLDKLDRHDPKRKDIQEKLDAMYQRRYPSTRPVLQGRA